MKEKQMIIKNDILEIYESLWSVFFKKKKNLKCFSKILKMFLKISSNTYFYVKNTFKKYEQVKLLT